MDTPITSIRSEEGLKAHVYSDIDPMHPRIDFDTVGSIVCWHRRYALTDPELPDFVEGPEKYDPTEWAEEFLKSEDVISLPIYMYDHSGITINTTGFSCGWDSGQVGWIFVSRAKAQKEWGVETVEDIQYNLRQEIEIYSQYLEGDIYGVVVEQDAPCDECGHNEPACLDQVWGIYGFDDAKEFAINLLAGFLTEEEDTECHTKQ